MTNGQAGARASKEEWQMAGGTTSVSSLNDQEMEVISGTRPQTGLHVFHFEGRITAWTS